MRYPLVALALLVAVVSTYTEQSQDSFIGNLIPDIQLPWFRWNRGSQKSNEKSKEKSKEKSHEHKHGSGHGHGKSRSSSSSDSNENSGWGKTTMRRSSVPPSTTFQSRSPRRSTVQSSTVIRESRTTRQSTIQTTSTVPIQNTIVTSTCPAGPSSAPITRVLKQNDFVYNPDITFTITQNSTGCDSLTISCSGYFSAFISAQWTENGAEVIFEFPADAPDNFTLVTTTTTLAWEKFGWGAPTQDLTIKDNAFYCMVGSLAPDSQPSQGPSCSCQYDKVWVDLMILIESSESIGDMGLQEIFGYVQTSLNWFNIQLANSTDPFHTRIGLIIYDAEPKLLASLGTMTGDQLQNFGEVEYLGGDTTSIDKSMAMAFKEFDGPNRRKNARKMIALFATSFNTMSDDALDRARNFEEDDGIMYVYNFVEEDSIPRPELKELATTGYFWDYSNDYRGEGFMVSLCNSNCYCMDDYSSFEDNPVDGTPKAGCYYSVNTQSNFRLAISRCQRYNNGSIAQGKTQEKANFLQSQFEFSNARFWAGITWNAADNSYMWMDGTPIGNETYQPWGASRVSGQDCVAIMNNLWMPMDCRVGYEYICEAAPCDSQHYCEDEED